MGRGMALPCPDVNLLPPPINLVSERHGIDPRSTCQISDFDVQRESALLSEAAISIQWVQSRSQNLFMLTSEQLQQQLEQFRAASQNLQLEPLVTRAALERLGVEYQTELIDELEQAIE